MAGFHLFPFRTEKLSPPAPMVLHTRGRVGSRRFLEKKPFGQKTGGLFCFRQMPAGYSGLSGLSGISGLSGSSGISGFSCLSGTSGLSGIIHLSFAVIVCYTALLFLFPFFFLFFAVFSCDSGMGIQIIMLFL